MRTRIVTAAILFCITLPVFIFSHTLALPIAAVFLSVFGTYEMLRCVGIGRYKSVLIPSLVFAALFSGGTSVFFFDVPGINMTLSSFLVAGLAVCFFYLLFVFGAGLFFQGALKFSDLGSAALMVIYIVFSFASIVLLRCQPNGVFLLYLTFIGPFLTDAFAYFTGVFFGKHKLLPAISPKKTVEGSIGGTVFGSASYLLFGLAISLITAANPDIVGVVLTPNYVALAIYGLIISVVSQIGDLAMSWIKREHGVKDYGKIFPGHGGVLDRFDSVLITAPLLLLFSTLEGPLAMFF